MKTISPRARTNLELILREIDVLCKGLRFPSRKSRPGRKPEYPDKLIVKLVVVQHLLGYTSERSFLRFVPELKCPAFAQVPDQSQYNRRAKSLKPVTEKLILRMQKDLKIDRSRVRILDATPVPVVRIGRANRRKILTDQKQVSIGYCASQKTWFCGSKLSLLVNQEGIPCEYHLMAAHHHDLKGFRSWLKDRRPRGLVIVADKGYLVKPEEKKELREKRLIRLVVPYRTNQKKKNTRKERFLLKKRKIIETVIGQLKDQMNLERLRAKTYQGLSSRIDNIIFTYIFGVYFNKRHCRNPLNLKSILT